VKLHNDSGVTGKSGGTVWHQVTMVLVLVTVEVLAMIEVWEMIEVLANGKGVFAMAAMLSMMEGLAMVEVLLLWQRY